MRIVACLLALGLVVSCAASFETPREDFASFPCGSPVHHYCATKIDGARTCCPDRYDCPYNPAGGDVEFFGCRDQCCFNGGAAAPRDGGSPSSKPLVVESR